jgi:hypothetical protein
VHVGRRRFELKEVLYLISFFHLDPVLRLRMGINWNILILTLASRELARVDEAAFEMER